MRLLFAMLLLSAAPAQAFLFFGVARDRKAAAGLAEMRAAAESGDCAAVLGMSEAFLSQKPPAEMRARAYAYMGACYEQCGSTDKAINIYQLALGLYPSDLVFASRLALIYNTAGFYENAVPLFLKVLSMKPGDVQANLGLGRAYAALGFLSRAKEFYSKAVVLQDFRDAGVLEEYARCMLRKRDWQETLFVTGKGALLSPRSAVWPLLEARVSAGKGDYYGAVSSMDRAIIFAPDRKLRLERALYLLLGGLPRRAIKAAEAELAAEPGDALASAVKGMALYNLGDKSAALAYLLTARTGGPFTAAVAGALMERTPAGEEAACKK